jgi:general secretion pathway protein G
MTKARIGFAIIQVSLIGAICSVGAGIVAPDLSARGTSLEETKFMADLQTIRCQLELYKIQHDEQLPPTQKYADFEKALTTRGDDNRGPYLRIIPTNPFNGSNVVRFEKGQSTAGCGLAGWVLNTVTGDFQSDDSLAHAAL